ncbi:kinase-like domain-containing protein [Hyaloraphidium curvatum]|nr:kinase-like domain-containing protein [Hyaloraphidium curvatum]
MAASDAFDALFERACRMDGSAEWQDATDRLLRGFAERLRAFTDVDGNTAAAAAAALGHEYLLEGLLRGGAPINAPNAAGETPLLVACRAGQAGAVGRILRSRRELRDPGRPAADGHNAFTAACARGDAAGTDVVQALYDGAARLDPKTFAHRDAGGRTGLMIACANNDVALVELLLSRPDLCVPNAQDDNGCTAFNLACRAGAGAVLRLLVDAEGIDFKLADATGAAPVDLIPDQQLRVEIRRAVFDAAPEPLRVESSRIAYDPNDRSTLLGGGTFGDVWRGTFRLEDGKIVPAAVKVRKNPTPANVAAFVREARVWAAVQHKCILSLYGFNETGLELKIASELADRDMAIDLYHDPKGRFRSRRLLTDINLYYSYALYYLLDVAHGMRHLHSCRVIHGDLKPLNVLIVGNRAKIADFGTARYRDLSQGPSHGASSSTDYGAGTMYFNPPESLNLLIYRKHRPADVWSFGMMLWQATAKGYEPYFPGQQPNTRISEPEIHARLVAGGRPAQQPDTPNGLWDLIGRCWQYDGSKAPAEQPRPGFEVVVAELEKVIAVAGYARPPA